MPVEQQQSMDFEDWEERLALGPGEDVHDSGEKGFEQHPPEVPNTPQRKFYTVNGDGSIHHLLRIRGKQKIPPEVREFRQKQGEIYMTEFVEELRRQHRDWDINIRELYVKGPHPQV